MEKALRNKKTILFFVGPALILYLAVMLYPITHAIYISLFRWDLLGTPSFIGFQNYVRMFTRDAVLIRALQNTLGIFIGSLVGQLGLGFLFASMLAHGTKFKNLFRNFFFLPAVLSSAAVGSMWTFMYNPSAGIVNGFLRLIGLDVLARNWLTDENTALGAIIAVVIWQFTGYTMTLFMAAINGIPQEVYESAKIDGANPFQIMFRITLPLIMPIVRVATILITVGSLRFFDLVYVMTPGGGPNRMTEVIASLLFRRSFTHHEFGYGAALSVLLLVLSLIATLIVNRAFKRARHEY